MNEINKWLEEIRKESFLESQSKTEEARSNLSAFSFSNEQLDSLGESGLLQFINDVLGIYTKKAKKDCLLYCWVDQASFQLRFSMIRASHELPPFSPNVSFVNEINKVIDSFLKIHDESLGEKRWEDTTSVYLQQVDL